MDPQIVWQCPQWVIAEAGGVDWASLGTWAAVVVALGLASWEARLRRTERNEEKVVSRHRIAVLLRTVLRDACDVLDEATVSLKPDGGIDVVTEGSLFDKCRDVTAALSSWTDRVHAFDAETAHQLLSLQALFWQLTDKFNRGKPYAQTETIVWRDIRPIGKEQLLQQRRSCHLLTIKMETEATKWIDASDRA